MIYPSPESFQTAESLKGFLMLFQFNGEPVPEELQARYNELVAQEATAAQAAQPIARNYASETPIYDELVRVTELEYGKMPDEKVKCIQDTVAHLLEEGEGAEQPGLLLGKIQSGKTDTFVKIMGLAFDKGFDACIVFTKGTNALADQTVSRMEDDFEAFSGDNELLPKVAINDIMAIKGSGLTPTEINGQKNIIICKKEDDNIRHLISVFTDENKSPLLQEKKILIIDDEADFASWNYMKKNGTIRLAVITQLINEFIHIPQFCRYLQVTATPYSLYLQPDQSIEIEEDGYVRPMRPRFTSIVPVHSKYVGGEEYFVKPFEQPESMYAYLFHQISDKCLSVMKNKNMKYVSNILTSQNIYDFRNAILSYVMATVIRKVQQEDAATLKERDYRSSCLIHLQVSTSKHAWQEDLVRNLFEKIQEAYTTGETLFFDELFDSIYESFEASNAAARADGKITKGIPSKERLKEAMRVELSQVRTTDVVSVVNSVHGVKELLDKKNGQLKLRSTFNIFIGGSILDRGITINNMLSFFYGRETTEYQQDTVLQHMRQYGSRSNLDMAVTRLHTTAFLYSVMVAMHRLDEQLRDWLTRGEDPECKAIFVGYSDDMAIRPCSKNKVIVSDTITMTPSFRQTVWGFQTGTKTDISRIVNGIDDQLKALPDYVEDQFFDVPKSVIKDILHKIRTTYIYDDDVEHIRWNNLGLDWDENSMTGCLDYLESDTVHLMVRTGMHASRVRQNGKFVDAPDTGSTDLKMAREVAQDNFAIMLFREEGLKEEGWRGTPFYWPVLVGPANLKSAIFTIGAYVPEFNVAEIDLTELLEGVADDEFVKLPLRKEKFEPIVNREITEDYQPISERSASLFLKRDILYNFVLKEGINPDTDINVYSYNDGVFPYETRDLKYLLYRVKAENFFEFLLVKVDQEQSYEVDFDEAPEPDKLLYPGQDPEDVTYDNQVHWFEKFTFKPYRSQRFYPGEKTPVIQYKD